jgi:Cdc6-like AAA superfamily ATPase
VAELEQALRGTLQGHHAFLSATPQHLGPIGPFVAREQELAELAAALATARSGAGQILFVIGGAGRGKTMLVQEFARPAQAADAELLVVSGYGNVHTGTGAISSLGLLFHLQRINWRKNSSTWPSC